MAPSEVCELDFHQYRGVFYTVTYDRFEDFFLYSDFLPHTKLLDIEFDIVFMHGIVPLVKMNYLANIHGVHIYYSYRGAVVAVIVW